MACQHFRTGDFVVYKKTKFSAKPGPRARRIEPARNGDTYRYQVDKYWVVVGIAGDDRLIVKTPGGKEQTLNNGDPNLRRAHWWEKLLYRNRFESLRRQIAIRA